MLVAAAGLLLGCAQQQPATPVDLPAPSPELNGLYNQQPEWSECGKGVECATIATPLDWDDPTGASIDLALARRPADRRSRGVVVLDFGGPGVAGAARLRDNPDVGTARLRQRMNLVAFDPRGTGDSAPVDCLTDSEMDDLVAGDLGPQAGTVLARGCAAAAPDLVAHLDTGSTVRDLDLIRSVLDQPALNYLGYSYGTLVGARYADQFTPQVGRFVLDGAMDPSVPPSQVAFAQAIGMEDVFTAYLRACVAGQAGDCPYEGDQAAAGEEVTDLLARISARPLPTSTSRQLTQQLAVTGIIAALYSQQRWPELSAALDQAENGDGTGLLALADGYNDRRSDGSYGSNLTEAYWATICADVRAAPDQEEDVPDPASITAQAPILGPSLVGQESMCAAWPAPASPGTGAVAVQAAGAPPIVVIGTTHDPATPYLWARSLADQLESGVLVSVAGTQHLAYGRGNSCVDELVEDYLVDGEAPADGIDC